MANRIINTSLETIEGIAKAAQRGIGDMANDAKQAVTGDIGTETAAPKTVSDPTKKQIKSDDQAKMQQMRQNLAQINQQIQEARKKREHKEVQEEQKQVQEKQIKKQEDKKKNVALDQSIKSQQGSKEVQRVSG